MEQNLDREIRTRLLESDINIPDKCRNRINETIRSLPEKTNKIRRIQFRTAIAMAVTCILVSSITVYAAIDHVRNRMESLPEEEKDSYYEGLQNSPANADSYSRELTDSERARMKELREKYENGTFPAGKLPVVKTQSDADSSIEYYFVEDTSLFVLPERELTEEEMLEMIDFYYCRDYSLNEKVKDLIVTPAPGPEEFIEKGGMDEQKAIALAETDIKNIYGIDGKDLETKAEYNSMDGNGNLYIVTMNNNETKSTYIVFIDADQGQVIDIFYTKISNNIAEGIEVDEAKFVAMYEDALDLLRKWKGTDLPIIQSTCEYNYNSEDCLEYGIVNYLFETEDGTGYILYYSCVNDIFFKVFIADYDEYRQRIDQAKEKRQEGGIERKIIQMQ